MDHDPNPTDEPQQELESTAEEWRDAAQGTEAEASAEEVASGAEKAAEQPDYGREGS